MTKEERLKKLAEMEATLVALSNPAIASIVSVMTDIKTLQHHYKESLTTIGDKWPCIYLTGDIKTAVLDLVMDHTISKLEKLTEKTLIDNPPQA